MVSIVPGDGAAGAALVREPDIDKVAFTGSTGVGKDIQAALAGRGVSLTLELGGKSANIVFEDAALDQAVEGIVNGIFFNQGHVCCAGSRLLIQESVADTVIGKLWERMGRLRVGDPLDKNTDVGAINSREQLDRIQSLVAAGEEEGAVRRSIACDLPERGWWFAPTVFTEVAPAHRIAVEEIFGPGRVGADVPHPGGGDREGEQLDLRAGRRHLDRQGREGVRGRRRAAGRRGLAEHLQPLRPDRRVRRLQGERLRPRGRPGRAAPLPARVMSRLAVPKTYKLYIGGAFVRSESGRYDRHDDRNVPRASRKDVRDAVAAARKAAGPWAARTAYNRGQILYRAAEALESRAADFAVERGEVEAAIDVLVHYAGWTDKLAAVLGGVNPVAAPFLSFSLPEPTGVVGVVAPDEPELLGLVAELAPALAAGNTVVAVLSEAAPLGGLDLGEVLGVSDVPGGVVNLLSGRRRELTEALAAHPGVNAIVNASGDGSLAADDRPAGRGERHARAPRRRRPRSYEAAVADALARLEAVTELKTAWHPVGA